MAQPPVKNKARFSETNPDEDAILEQAVQDTYSAVAGDDESLDESAAWLRAERSNHKSLHWLQRPSIYMIGMAVALFSFATSAGEATRQMIQFKLACNSILESSGVEVCDPRDTQVLVLSLQQAFSIALGIATIVALGKVAPLSDKYGRKTFLLLILLFQLLGKLSRYIIMSRYPTLQFALMVATEALANCFGGLMTILMLSNCYASDIADVLQRPFYLGIIMACFFVGLSTGPLAGNALLAYFRDRPQSNTGKPHANYGHNIFSQDFMPLRLEACIILTCLLFVAFVVPESRGENARRMSRSLSRSLLIKSLRPLEQPTGWRRALKVFNFLRPIRLVFYPKDSVNRSRHATIASQRIAVIILVMADCLLSSLAVVIGEIYVLYGIYQFGWTAKDIGTLMALGCSSRAFSLVVLAPLLNKKVLRGIFGLRVNQRRFDLIDYWSVAFAFGIEVVGQFCLTFTPTGGIYLMLLVMNAFSSVATPAINSAVVKFFPESKTGEVFGSMALVKNIFSILSPVAFLGVYKFLLSAYSAPQFIFMMFAGIFLLVLLLITYVIIILERLDMDREEITEAA